MLSYINLKVKDQLRFYANQDRSKMLNYNFYSSYMHRSFKEAVSEVQRLLFVAGEPSNVIKCKCLKRPISDSLFLIIALPRSSLSVLLTARKVAEKSAMFNFEAVYQKYRQYKINAKKSTSAQLIEISRQTFLKIFLDLVN